MEQSKTGILLVNLGSPDTYEPADVKVYLREFLTDKRVIDIPAPIRKAIVETMILPFRPKESGEAYELIWWDEGSPLIVITQRVIDKLQDRLGEHVPIAMGMRYGNPSIEAGFDALMEKNPELEKVFMVPLYPQYAMATTETVIEKAKDVWRSKYPHLKMETKQAFYDDPLYVKALGESIRPYIEKHDIDHLMFSYHGVPERHIKKRDITGDHCLKCDDCCNVDSPAHTFCYRHQDLKTTQNAVDYLDLDHKDFNYSYSFQSKLGIDPWLSPATDSELKRLAEDGVKKIAVACPAFISDCIETLEEIGIRGKEDFIEAGGEDLILIPCLNDNDLWIDALENWCTDKVMSAERTA
ncbi:MAG: ferrochelatase [Balneolaceae bacterium]